MARGDPTYCKIDVDVILKGERFNALSEINQGVYLKLWALAVALRTDTFMVESSPPSFLASCVHSTRQRVFSCLNEMCEHGLAERNTRGDVRIRGVKDCHPKLQWDKCPKASPYGEDKLPQNVPIGSTFRDSETPRVPEEIYRNVVRSRDSVARPGHAPDTTTVAGATSDPPGPGVGPASPARLDPRREFVKRLEIEFGGNNGDELADELLSRNVSLEQIERAAEITRERRGEIANPFGFFRAQLRNRVTSALPQQKSTPRRFYIANETIAAEIVWGLESCEEDYVHIFRLIAHLPEFAALNPTQHRAIARRIAAEKEQHSGRSYGHIIADACEAVLRESILLSIKEL